MFDYTEKQFRNTADTPIVIAVVAESNDEGIVGRFYAAGGTLHFDDAARAEALRMHKWVIQTFKGQSQSFFAAHNGIVPDPVQQEASRLHRKGHEPVTIVNTVTLGEPFDAEKAAQAVLRGIRDAEVIAERGNKAAASAPQPGTYWQDRNRLLRHFLVTEVKACSGHAHVRMTRVDGHRGGVYDFPYENDAQWSKLFKQAREEDVPVAFRAARESLLEDWLTGVGGVPSYMQQFLDAVSSEGNELPPAVGERYHSYISDQTYTVVDVRRKLHDTDLYVTMERDGDKHRAKFTYRDHAHWLTVWRPLDHEDKPRKTVEIELKVDAADAMRQVGEAAHEAAEAALVFNQGHTLNRIVRELDRRVPGWQKQSSSGPQIEFGDRMIRAIRTLNRMHGRKENDDLREENKRLQATLEARTKEVDSLKHERGGSWGPERIRTEQDRMREMLFEFTRLFKYTYGVERVKTHMQAFDVTSMMHMPLEVYLGFMRDCRAYAEKHMP